MKPAIIFGAGRQARIIASILRIRNEHPIKGFLDDDATKHGHMIDGIPVLGGMDWLERNTKEQFAGLVAIGNNTVRVSIGAKLRQYGIEMINAIHPSAVIMPDITLGTGTLICAGAVVVSGTCIEDDVVINTATSIDHDSRLHKGAYVSPGVHTAGCVTIGSESFVGVGAVLGPNVTIGNRSVVGAGSVVLASMPAHALIVGTPARVIRILGESIDWTKILAR